MHPVLVVEADETLRETIEMILEEEGITTIGVCDIAAALMVLRTVDFPWVVLLDEWHTHPADLRAQLPDHTFVLMSTSPEYEPPPMDPVTGQPFSVLRLPFAIDELVNRVRGATVSVPRIPCKVRES